MRCAALVAVCLFLATISSAQSKSAGPTNEKAQKSYKEAQEWLKRHKYELAVNELKKADKQDGGHCWDCQTQILRYASQIGNWKAARAAAEEVMAEAQTPAEAGVAHYQMGAVLLREGMSKPKAELFRRAHEEFTAALSTYPGLAAATFSDGEALAYLHQDDAAKVQFEKYVKLNASNDLDHRRALRFVAQPELARERMAPAFELTTTNGERVSLDGLQGKVVLLDFWATWCGPCREALPHMRQIAKKFQGQPLVVLSVSLDEDEDKWKSFVAKNEMTWLQYRDGSFEGPIATLFGVNAIPHTFTIDSDGVLQDEHIGDASVEGKLKKLIARAQAQEVAAADKSQ